MPKTQKSKPQLNLERLSEIADNLNVPLVLHGGSGLSDDDFRNTVARGIAKINIFTDLCLAGNKAIQEGLAEGLDYLSLRNKKVAAIKEAIRHKMRLFGSNNRY